MSDPEVPKVFSGSKMYKARRAVPLSRAKLGKLLKRTPQTIWNWERNLASPSAKMVGEIAFHLDRSISYFYEDGEPAPPQEPVCPE